MLLHPNHVRLVWLLAESDRRPLTALELAEYDLLSDWWTLAAGPAPRTTTDAPLLLDPNWPWAHTKQSKPSPETLVRRLVARLISELACPDFDRGTIREIATAIVTVLDNKYLPAK